MLILPVLYEKERESKRGTRRRPIVLSSNDVGLAYLVIYLYALPTHKQMNTYPIPALLQLTNRERKFFNHEILVTISVFVKISGK